MALSAFAPMRSPADGHSSRFEYHLDAIIILFQEEVEALWRILQSHTVRDDKTRIALAVLDAFEQRLQVALGMISPALYRQGSVHRLALPDHFRRRGQ